MLTSSSVIPAQKADTGAGSLAGELFGSAGIKTVIPEGETSYAVPPSGMSIMCGHCNRTVIRVFKNYMEVVERHDQQYHKTVIPFSFINEQREKSAY